MTATFDFNNFDELNTDFLRRLKNLYRGKKIKLTLAILEDDVSVEELNNRIRDIEEGKNIISFDENTFHQKVQEFTASRL